MATRCSRLTPVVYPQVVVPLSVLSNWMAELRQWCPALRAIKLHSSEKSERFRLKSLLADVDSYDVVRPLVLRLLPHCCWLLLGCL